MANHRSSTTIIFAGCRRRDRPVRGPTQSRVRLPVFLVEDGLVTDAQVRRLREKRMSGKTLAAAAAGMSERTAGCWQHGGLPSTAKAPRSWGTREESRGRSLRRVSLWVSIRAGGRDRSPERPEVICVHLAGTHSGMQGGDRSAPGRVQALVLRLSCTAAWRIVATAYRTRPSSEAVESVEWGERKRIC